MLVFFFNQMISKQLFSLIEDVLMKYDRNIHKETYLFLFGVESLACNRTQASHFVGEG